jgi:TnpA family transposase
MLGYRFSPRIADLSDQRFWRATAASDPRGDYGPLNAIARNRVNVSKIAAHWPDMLRVAGSLVADTVRKRHRPRCWRDERTRESRVEFAAGVG